MKTKLGNNFNLIKRKNGSIYVKILGNNFSQQVDLDCIIDQYILCEKKCVEMIKIFGENK